MAPIRKHVGRDKFGTLFGTLRTQQYLDPGFRPAPAVTHRTISWNASGGLVATGASDRTIRVWNPERTSSRAQTELKGHTFTVEKVLFNPVREFELASCAADGTVRFWDTRSKNATSKLDIGGDPFTLSWSVDGTVLLAGTKGDTLIPISTAIPSSPTILARHKQEIQTNQTTFSNAYPPTDLLITRGDGSVKILDYPSMNILHSLPAHTSSCMSIAYNPNGRLLAIGGTDAMVSLWDTTDWICRRTISLPNSQGVRNLSWSWDGRYIVAAGLVEEQETQGHLEIYHAETGDVVYAIPTGKSGVFAAEWHPSRYWLAYTQIEDSGNRKNHTTLKVVGAAGGPTM